MPRSLHMPTPTCSLACMCTHTSMHAHACIGTSTHTPLHTPAPACTAPAPTHPHLHQHFAPALALTPASTPAPACSHKHTCTHTGMLTSPHAAPRTLVPVVGLGAAASNTHCNIVRRCSPLALLSALWPASHTRPAALPACLPHLHLHPIGPIHTAAPHATHTCTH